MRPYFVLAITLFACGFLQTRTEIHDQYPWAVPIMVGLSVFFTSRRILMSKKRANAGASAGDVSGGKKSRPSKSRLPIETVRALTAKTDRSQDVPAVRLPSSSRKNVERSLDLH